MGVIRIFTISNLGGHFAIEGSNMIFHSLTFEWSRREVLKTGCPRFSTFPRDLANVNE